MWTQCWLDYKNSKERLTEYKKYFASVSVDGFEYEEIKTALNEITLAAKTFSDETTKAAGAEIDRSFKKH